MKTITVTATATAAETETETAMMDIIPKAKSLRPAVLCDTKAICDVIDCFIAAQHAVQDLARISVEFGLQECDINITHFQVSQHCNGVLMPLPLSGFQIQELPNGRFLSYYY